MIKKVRTFLIKNIQWFLLLFCLVGFFILAKSVFYDEIMRIDTIGYDFISRYFINDNVTPIAKFITGFGGSLFLISLTLILLFTIKNKKIGACICANLILISSLNVTIKSILQRPRPLDFILIEESGFSFPSGHSMVSAAFYGFLIYLIYHYVKNSYQRWGMIIFLVFLIFLIGISRIYLGVHYTSDVLAGFLISISYLIVYIKVVYRFVLPEQK